MKYHGGRLSLKLQATLRTAFLLLGGGVREANTESLDPIATAVGTHACLTKLQLFSKLCLVSRIKDIVLSKPTSIFDGEIPRATAKNSP